jgi:ribonucleoside-triphosphate reductase
LVIDVKVVKKDGRLEDFDFNKIIDAVQKSADRVGEDFTIKNIRDIEVFVVEKVEYCTNVTVESLHEIVIESLQKVNHKIADSYSSYREYKKKYNKTFENILVESKSIVFTGNKDNANKDSQLNSTKKELVSGSLSKQIYLDYELPSVIAQAHKDGDIYIHDTSDRLFGSINCCLFDMGAVLNGGFNLNGVKYTEPTSAESALRVLSDVILQASSQQYGGFTVPEIDTVLAPYVNKAIKNSFAYYRKNIPSIDGGTARNLALKYVERALEQGFQATETRLNTINNSNGQTAFITLSFGLDTSISGRLVSKVLLENRKNGIGANHLTPVFPKLVFLHRNGINGEQGDPNYDIYLQALDCSLTRMYPDYLSLNEGYLGEIFDKHEVAISPMGCRAFLSPWYKDGGQHPSSPTDPIVYTGRANCGAITINTVRCAIEAKGDVTKFFQLFDKNLNLALTVHDITYQQLSKIKASSNPLFFCEGGCHIKLDPNETIERAIRTFTWGIGYIGLTEASYLMTGKATHEDNSFAIKVLEHLNKQLDKAKEEMGLLFAVYATPAESLCYTFRDKDYEKYGEIKGVTDKPYYMNSFHVDVQAPVNAIQKQDIEDPLFHLSKGGRITFNEFPNKFNFQGVKEVVDYAMTKGKYFGVNIELDMCNDCDEEGEFEDYICPNCGSSNITMIDRVCGYLSYRKLDGDTRYNKGKFQEVEDRVDHFGIVVDMEGKEL